MASNYVRCTPNLCPTEELCPIQAPPVGLKPPRGLLLLSSLLKVLCWEISLYYLDQKHMSRIFREKNFPALNNSLWRILFHPNKCFSNNNDVFSVYCDGVWGISKLLLKERKKLVQPLLIASFCFQRWPVPLELSSTQTKPIFSLMELRAWFCVLPCSLALRNLAS